MKLTKQEVQKRVLYEGTKIKMKYFTWKENTNTFYSELNGLVFEFETINNCTFKTGSDCTFKTGSRCTFDTGSDCVFDTGSDCVFNTGSDCIFNTYSDCIFNTGSNCIFNTRSYCIFNTRSYCTFDTGSYCTFNTGSNCTFNTGSDCVIVRRDTFDVIKLKERVKTQLLPHNMKGYLEDGHLNGDTGLGKHIIVDNILSKIISHKDNIYKVINYGEKKESYIIQDEDLFAHGDTIKEAKEDLKYKIGNIDTSIYKELSLDSIVTLEYAIKMYRAITGACAKGTRYFVESQETTKEKYSIKELIDLTNGQYGNEKFKNFFNKEMI